MEGWRDSVASDLSLDTTSLPNKNLDFSCFPAFFQVFHRFKSIRNLIPMILVGLTCILDGSGSILWEFPIFAMESLASLESSNPGIPGILALSGLWTPWHPWNPWKSWKSGNSEKSNFFFGRVVWWCAIRYLEQKLQETPPFTPRGKTGKTGKKKNVFFLNGVGMRPFATPLSANMMPSFRESHCGPQKFR